MRFTVDECPRYYSVFSASRLLGVPALRALALFEESNTLYKSYLGAPVTSMEGLKHFPKFKKNFPCGLSPMREIPELSPGQKERAVSKRIILNSLPGIKFLCVEEYPKTFKEFEQFNQNLKNSAAWRGCLHMPHLVEIMISKGKFRRTVRRELLYYLMDDFLDGYSWASPVEMNWRAGASALRRAANLHFSKIRAHYKGKPFWTLAVNEHLSASSMDLLELNTMMRTFKGSRLSKSVTSLDEEASAQHHILEMPTRELASFTFQEGPIRLPNPEDGFENYVFAFPSYFMQALVRLAEEWVDALQEDRTAYRRSHQGLPDDVFKKEFSWVEERVYINRFAWQSKYVKALLPAGFQFLF
jgi:hypothetical protein